MKYDCHVDNDFAEEESNVLATEPKPTRRKPINRDSFSSLVHQADGIITKFSDLFYKRKEHLYDAKCLVDRCLEKRGMIDQKEFITIKGYLSIYDEMSDEEYDRMSRLTEIISECKDMLKS